MDIRLFYTPHTRALRPRWLLEEIGVPYALEPVDLFGGERNPDHPLGQVPSARLDGERYFESAALCSQLADACPEKGLAPEQNDPLRRLYEQWLFFVPATMEPPAIEILLHTQILPEDERVPAIVPHMSRRYRRILDMLEEELGSKDYLVGNRFSVADLLAGHTLTWLPDMLEDYPALTAYSLRVTGRAAYRRAIAPLQSAA